MGAIDCSKYWQFTLEAQSLAFYQFAESLYGLIAVEACSAVEPNAHETNYRPYKSRSYSNMNMNSRVLLSECNCWNVLLSTLKNNILPSLDVDSTIIGQRLNESHVYFGNLSLMQFKQSLSNTRTLPVGSDEHVDAALKTAQEWNIYRQIRHRVILEYIMNAVVELMFEVSVFVYVISL